MIRSKMWMALAGVCLTTRLIAAPAPSPADSPKVNLPPIVAQAQSLDLLLKQLKEGMALVLPPKQYKQFEKEILANVSPEKLKGIDFTRPFAAYANPDPSLFEGDFEKSVFVVLVPVTVEKEFIELLSAGKPALEKQADGHYDLPFHSPGGHPPGDPPDMTASVRFLHRYAYIGIAGKNLDPSLLPMPKALIDEKEKAAFALRISPERLQPGIKNALFDSLHKLEEQLKTAENVPPSVRELGFSGIKLLGNWSKAVLDDSKVVTIRLLNESKGMMQTFEIELEPKPKSTLALLIRSMKKTTNRFASLGNNDNNVQHFFMKWPLFGEDLKDCTLKLLKVAQEEGLPLAPPDASAMLTELVNLGKRTVETGDLDLAFVIRGPNKDKLFSAILAISAKGPEEFEKALKVFIAALPEKDRERIKLDVAKIDDVGVHEIDVSDVPGAEQFEKVIGKEMKIRFAFGKDAACAAIGPDGMAMIKETLHAKAGPAMAMEAVSDGKRNAEIVKLFAQQPGQPTNPLLALMGQIYTREGKQQMLKLDVQGGETLKVQLGYPVMMAGGLFFGIQQSTDEESEDTVPQVVPAPLAKAPPAIPAKEPAPDLKTPPAKKE